MEHDVEEVNLSESLRGLFIHVPNSPVIDFELNFRSGYQFIDEKIYDTPHVLEHMIGGENDHYSGRKALRRAMDQNGAYHNAMTNYLYNRYIFEAAHFDAERMLDVQLAALTSPKFSDKEFNKELSVVGDELSGRLNDYERELSILLDREMGMDDLLDYETRLERLNDVSLGDIKDYYKKSHTQENSRFIVAGDLSEKREYYEKKLRSELSKLPKGNYWEFNQEKDRSADQPVHLIREVPTSVYIIRFVTKGGTEFKHGIIRNLMQLMLTGMWNSLIFGEGRDRGVLYGIGSGSGRSVEHSTFSFSGSVQNVNIEEMMKFIGEKLKEFKEGKFDDSLLEDAKQYRKGQFVRNYQTSSDLVGWYYGDYVFDDSIYALDSYIPTIESVNKDDILELANDFFTDDIWGMGLLTNQQSKDIDVSYLQKTLRESYS